MIGRIDLETLCYADYTLIMLKHIDYIDSYNEFLKSKIRV